MMGKGQGMIYLMLILAVVAGVYLGCRLFFLKKSIREAQKELKEITLEPEENRIVKLESPNRELESLLEAVNKNLAVIRKERLSYSQKEKQLKEQVENISHDLRTPLTAILGYLKMIDTRELSGEDREYLETALRKAETLKNLIARFYELSRVSSADFRLKLAPVDCTRVLRETCLENYAAFEKAHIRVSMELLDTTVFLLADREALERVFGNLLQNSIRYAKSCLEICVEQNKEKNSVIFVFKNDIEPHLEAETPERLFERFYMQEQSRSRGGTGLGLTISKHLVEHMRGEIRAEYSGGEKNEITAQGQRFLIITMKFPC